MKENLAEGHLLLALKNCSGFLNELRTNQLSPKEYYELYMAVFDALEHLSSSLTQSHIAKEKRHKENHKNSSKHTPFLADLYELVQYSGNIIPRLYMMIAVGTAYMETSSQSTKEIMKDMIEMCKGVQHPIRGLFLRNYLTQRTKDLLPLSSKNDFNDTVQFLVSNFIEMNKLWVRLQHQGHSSERELRFRERKELRILVGCNLVRLSQVIDDFQSDDDYSGKLFYKENIYPTIVEQIIQCKDTLAQSYLIDVLIQIFPDDFHFSVLEHLLNQVFLKLHPLLKKADLIDALVERLVTNHHYESDIESSSKRFRKIGNELLTDQSEASEGPESKSEQHELVFQPFWDFFKNALELDPPLDTKEYCEILQSIMKLTLTYEPENPEHLGKIFQLASGIVDEKSNHEQSDGEIVSLWIDLLITPIERFKPLKCLLNLEFFYQIYNNIPSLNSRKRIASEIADKLIASKEAMSSVEEIDNVFKYISPLILDSDLKLDTAKDLGVVKTIKIEDGNKLVTEEFLGIQEKVCKLVHLIDHNEPLENLSNLLHLKKKFLSKNSDNIIYTYPTLVMRIISQLRKSGLLIKRPKSEEDKEKISRIISNNFKALAVTIDELYQYHQTYNSELILQLYLSAATVADHMKMPMLAYELFNQCFVVQEENLNISRHGKLIINPHESMGGSTAHQSILLIVNALAQLRYLSKENYESLITNITICGSKQLKKQDQCRSVYSCAHLWWWCELWINELSPTVGATSPPQLIPPTSESVEDGNSAAKGAALSADENRTAHPAEADNIDETQVPNASEKVNSDAGAVLTSETSEGLQNATFKDGNQAENEKSGLYRDLKRVLECLQKSLRVADSCMDPYLLLKLFVEILNRCLIFNIYGNSRVDSRYINGLIDLIQTNIANFAEVPGARTDETDDQEGRLLRHIKQFFDRTLQFIADQQEDEDRFKDIVV